MKVLLIIVVFNFETGAELATDMSYRSAPACHAAALTMFQEIEDQVTIEAMEVPEGQEMLEGTMIAYGADGGEIGMYACNVLRSTTG